MKKNKFIKFLKILILGTLAFFLFSYLLMSLWNWLIPDLFNGPTITMWQALGLFVLSKILFSGFGRGGGRCNYKRQNIWKRKFAEKLQKMTPEERDKFKNRFKRDCFFEE